MHMRHVTCSVDTVQVSPVPCGCRSHAGCGVCGGGEAWLLGKQPLRCQTRETSLGPVAIRMAAIVMHQPAILAGPELLLLLLVSCREIVKRLDMWGVDMLFVVSEQAHVLIKAIATAAATQVACLICSPQAPAGDLAALHA